MGFNGDLYVNLQHASGFSVLLNRVGKRADSLLGYGDPGLDIVLDDQAVNGDVHVYRMTLNGSNTTPLGGGLSGTWAPDGRAVDPDTVLDTTPRTATLAGFSGANPNGQWILFVADLQGGGQFQLENWSLSFMPIPESSGFAMATGLALLTWTGSRLARRSHGLMARPIARR